MSTSLLKKTLELLEADTGVKDITTNGKVRKLTVNKKPRNSNGQGRKRSRGHKSLWQTTDDLRKRLEINDQTEDNLRNLKLLSSGHVDQETANKILVRAGKKKSKEISNSVDERTAFTEEDFIDFEKEYFVSDK